jgi:hypothetical protein
MPNINWEAVIGMCALCGLVGGIVRMTVKGTLSEFKDELRKEFASTEHVASIERRVEAIEGAMRG